MRYRVYEVFGQRRRGEPHVHAGSLLAPDADLALLLARENFVRRDEFVSLWVVPRDHIQATPDEEFLRRTTDRSYRLGAGYRDTVVKWRRFRFAAGEGGDDGGEGGGPARVGGGPAA